MAVPRVRVEGSVDAVRFGKYLLLDRVAQGRTASVYRALLRREGEPDARFAIKRFTPELSRDRGFAQRAARVFERASQIEHEAHCRIAEIDRADDSLYVALEWIQGRDLKRVAAALRERGTTMPVALVAHVAAQVAEVLAQAHDLSRGGKPAPLLHGELSAADILIGYDGRVRLIGLGSAELAIAAHAETTRTAYQAPEIELGAPCSAQTDVFSLGACMLKVLSQRTELPRRADSHITQIVPRALKQIVDRAVAMQPAARWQSAGDLAHALQSWIAAQTQRADAEALAAFMRGLFGDVRAEPVREETRTSALRPKAFEQPSWEGPAEHTPANGILMEQLAAEMSDQAARAREENKSKSILEAIMNPADEPERALEPQSAPQPQPLAHAPAQAEVAMDGWDDAPWEVDEATVRAPIVPAQDTQHAQRHAPPARAQAPTIEAPRAPVVAAVQAAGLSGLESWQSERRSPPWLAISAVATAVLGLAVIFFVWGGDEDGKHAAAPSAGAPASAPVVPLDRARSAEVEPPGPQPVAVAVEPQVQTVVEPATATQRGGKPQRATHAAQRSRERKQAEVEPLAFVAEPAPVQGVEPPAPAIAAPPSAAPPPPPPEPALVVATPPAKPAPAPAPVMRGPTRAPIVIAKVAPAFPMRAKRMDITQGVVTIEYVVDKGGAVRDPRVVSANPAGVFDEAALKAIRQWHYQPALANGFPAESRQRFTFRFE